MIKRLIFDVDGTLICNVNLKTAFSNALKKYGIYSINNVNNYLLNLPLYEQKYNSYNKQTYLKYFSEVLNKELKEDFLDILFFELKHLVSNDGSKIKVMLEKFYGKYELVILSNYFSISQKNRLEEMGISKYFTDYYGEKSIKPNKQSYIDACGDNLPCECVMIGDNLDLDINGALKNGLKVVYVNNGKKINNKNILEINEVSQLTEEMIKLLEY